MDFENLFNDSIEYTRETFAGHWVRWLIFVLLGGLPSALGRFVIKPDEIITGTTIHWELIPWGSIAALAILGILASFFIAGYIVRIYRGTRPVPDFTGWASLFLDGIKLDIVELVWFLPALVVLLAEIALTFGLIFSGNPGLGILALLLIPVGLILFIIAILFAIPGAVRFARTGSMVEGWSFSAIRGILRRIGWVNYIIALILFVIVWIAFNIAVMVPALIPYVGWLVPIALAPFLTVFVARYFTIVYETGEVPTGAAPAGQPGP
jgi:Protein of unknown function (DUF4013)